jgi:hypothetical protein
MPDGLESSGRRFAFPNANRHSGPARRPDTDQNRMPRNRILLQLVWGGLLVAAGAGMFIRIPQVMPRIEQIGQFAAISPFIRFCLYLMGVILIGGGGKKLYANYHRLTNSDES